METKELKITIPENCEIDWQESAKQEKIVFKKKDTKPRSWEEYCKNHYGDYYYITSDSNIVGLGYNPGHCELSPVYAKNTIPSKELAEAFLAMMQLMSLRQAWIHKWSIDAGMTNDWKADWSDNNNKKYCIIIFDNNYIVDNFNRYHQILSFPTKEIAEDFTNCFKDLLETAKPLL